MPAAHHYPQSHWSPERDAAFAPMWKDGLDWPDIIEAINTIPGPRPITDRKTLAKRAEVLGIKRPAWYLTLIRQRISAAGNAVQAEKRRSAPPKPPRPKHGYRTGGTRHALPAGHAMTALVTKMVVSELPLSSRRTCQFISGEPRRHEFCGAPSVVGLSWCPMHAEVVFSNWPEVRRRLECRT